MRKYSMSSEVVVAFDLVWSGVSHPMRKYSSMLSDVLWCPFAILDVERETLIVTFLPTCSNIKVPFLIHNKVFAKSTTDAWQCDFYQAIMKLANFFPMDSYKARPNCADQTYQK